MKIFYFLPLLSINVLFAQTLTPPDFSKPGGFYEEEFQLELSHQDPEAVIIYTLDGSEPEIDNLDGKTYTYKKRYQQFVDESPYEFYENILKTNLYQEPLTIYDRTVDENRIANISTSYESNPYFPQENVDKSFVVRAKTILGEETSETVTNIYFINKNYTLPIVNLNLDDDLLFGYENGLFVAGKVFDQWRENNPSLETNLWTPANYWSSGSSSEIKLNFVYFDQNQEKINQYAGLRIQGNGSRHLKNRSHRLYAKKDYGKSKFAHSFFKEYDYDEFKRIIFRNSGTDTKLTMFRDAFVQTLNQHLNFETQSYQPVISFVNGEYYGIYNLRERFDDKYFERVFGIKEKDLDFLENDGIADAGDNVFYHQVVTFFKENDLSDEEKYQQALTFIDEVNYIDYYIAEIFAANYDWPQNNNEYFRKRVNYSPDAPYAQDGRFRWVMKDLDVSFNGMQEWISDSYRFNMIKHALDNTLSSADYKNDILHGFFKNETFKTDFINRFADLLNTTYQPDYMIALMNQMKSVLEPEIEKQIIRWNLIESKEQWEDNIAVMVNFAEQRPTFQKQHIIDYFELSGEYELTAETSDKNQGFIKVNTIEINNSTVGIDDNYELWKGFYFKDIDQTIEAIALPGYKFSHWEGDIESTEQKLTIRPTEDLYVKAVFDKKMGLGDIDKVDFLLYPNPAREKLFVQSSSASVIDYTITTMVGQQILQSSTKTNEIDIRGLKPGVYFIQLVQDHKKVTKKFIKQ